jgi:DNA topoisomerase IB
MTEDSDPTALAVHGLWRVLRTQWWVVLLCLVVGGGAAVGYSKLQHPRYQAQRTIDLPVLIGSAGASGAAGTSGATAIGSGASQLLTSSSTLQAVGRDAKGRAQYVYHADFAATQAAQKFSRVDRLRQEFDTVHRENAARQAAEEARMRAHADCLAVIMALGIRPGSDADTKAAVKAYGATTLEGRHVVTTDGETRLQYVGKKGVALDLPVHDPDVADLLRQRAAAAGPTGRLFPDVSGDSLRRYTQTLDHGTFKPKDFRTLKGTTVALDAMATVPTPTAPAQYVRAVKQVATQVARVLGNTPPVALQSYIDPTIFGEWRAHAHV